MNLKPKFRIDTIERMKLKLKLMLPIKNTLSPIRFIGNVLRMFKSTIIGFSEIVDVVENSDLE